MLIRRVLVHVLPRARDQDRFHRHGFVRQILSVLVLIVLLVSVPAMLTQFYHTDFASVLSGQASLLDLLLEDRAFISLPFVCLPQPEP